MKSALFSCFFFLSLALAAQATLPAATSFVSDFEKVFSSAQKKELLQLADAHRKKTGGEIAVITVDTLYGRRDFRTLATDFGSQWKVGQKGKNNGVVIVMSRKLREIFIAPGSGIQAVFTEEKLKKMIDEVFIPFFRQEKYFEGVKEGMKKIIAEWK